MLLGTMAVPALGACGRAGADPTDDRLGEWERRYNAYVGLFATDIASGHTCAHRADDPFAMCSTFKAYAAAHVLQKAQRGELDLQQPVFIVERQASAPAGVVKGNPRSVATCSDSSAPSCVESPLASAGSDWHASRQPWSASLSTYGMVALVSA
jgi:hypothetical protein